MQPTAYLQYNSPFKGSEAHKPLIVLITVYIWMTTVDYMNLMHLLTKSSMLFLLNSIDLVYSLVVQ